MPLPEQGVVQNSRAAMMAEVIKNREDEVDKELKEGGTTEGIAVLARDQIAEDDQQRPAEIPAEDWAAMSDEAKTEAIKATKASQAEAQTEEAKSPGDEQKQEASVTAAAEAPKKVKIKVDGQEQEVDEAAVLEAGIRAMQKESAADKRLEEATKAREEAERLRQSVEATIAKLPKAEEQTRQSDQEIMLAKDKLREVIKKIQYGGEEEAADALQQYVTEMAKTGQPKSLTEAELLNIIDLRDAQKFVKTNYADVVGDENLKQLFVTKVNAKLAAGDHRPYQDICKDIGDELRTWRGAPPKAEATQTQTSGASRAAVQQRKTSIVQIPSAAARQPAPSQPKTPSPTETIDQMRADRERQAGRK